MELDGWKTPASVVRYQKPSTEQLRASLQTRRSGTRPPAATNRQEQPTVPARRSQKEAPANPSGRRGNLLIADSEADALLALLNGLVAQAQREGILPRPQIPPHRTVDE